MKKGGVILVILIIVLIIIFLFLFIQNKTKEKEDKLLQEKILQEKINQTIQSEIISYCQDMSRIAKEKPWDSCGACFTTNMSDRHVSYKLTKIGDRYNITVNVSLIFDGRNDRPGMGKIDIIIDENGNILESINSADKGYGCMGFQSPEEIEKLKEAQCANETDKDDCYYELAKDELNISYCSKIVNNDLKDGCYYYIAVLRKDSSLCTNVLTISRIDSCYHDIGRLNEDIDDCNKVTNQNMKIGCISYVTEDSELCSQLPAAWVGWGSCVTNIAMKIVDSTICDYITYSTSDKELCYSSLA